MIRQWCLAIEEWTDDDSFILSMFKFFLVFGTPCAILIAGLAFMCSRHGQSDEDRCLSSGKGWAIAGSHYATSMVMVGKVFVPQTYQVTDYGCYEVQR